MDTEANSVAERARSLAMLAALPLTAWCIVLEELTHLPRTLVFSRAGAGPEAVAELAFLTLARLGWPLAFVAMVLAKRALGTKWPATPKWDAVWAVLLAALPTAHAYVVLVGYEAFLGYPPLVALFCFLWVYLAVAVRTVESSRRPGRLGLLLYWLPAAVGTIGGFVTLSANYRVYKDMYPTLHLAMLEAATALLGIGLVHVCARVPRWPALRVLRIATASVLAAFIAAVLARAAGAAEVVRPYVEAFTTIGQSRAVFENIGTDDPGDREPIPPDPAAEDRLMRAIGLPRLPEGFALRKHNILLVSVEALRFDATSLHDPALDTTPNLLRLADRGSFVFSTAISPSSATLHSMGAMLSMSYPSACVMESWKRSWNGVLFAENHTVAERLAEAGYGTFWVGHDHERSMSRKILGFSQGFQRRKLVYDNPDDAEDERAFQTDAVISAHAVTELKRAAKKKRPFFGWVFFCSPHKPYLNHEPEQPSETDWDLYLQDVRNADRQFGALLDHLEKSRLIENTIIVFMGDHGEEFYEHGGNRHKRTLYEEVVHVPMLIWVPGSEGKLVEQPVSSLYALPWLFLHDNGQLREEVLSDIQGQMGPMLRETDSAVVTELVGHDRMMAALVYPEVRVHFDFRTKLYEVYDTRLDPGEHTDLMLHDPDFAVPFTKKMDAYRRVRRALSRITLEPEKEEATPEDLELNTLAVDPLQPRGRASPERRRDEPK